MNIYVGNISHSVKEETLRELFEKIGAVASVKMITDKFTGAPRGFGFVQMKTSEDAQRAIEELNGYELEGRALTVSIAREREERGGGDRRPSSFSRGGGSRTGGGFNRGGGRGGDRY